MLIAGATAEIALEAFPNLGIGGVGTIGQKLLHSHDHSGSTEPALQSMLIPESLLNRIELVAGCQSLDGSDVVSISLHRKHGARFDGASVEHDRAGAADRGFAADVRTSHACDVAEVMDEQQARLDFIRVRLAVDGEGDLFSHTGTKKNLSETGPKSKRRSGAPCAGASGTGRGRGLADSMAVAATVERATPRHVHETMERLLTTSEAPSVHLANDLAVLFKRDLARLGQQIASFSDEAALWRVPAGITNSAGNLTLHIEGNLREYLARQLGGVPYARDRAKEFSARSIPRDELLARVESLGRTIPEIIEQLTQQQLEEEYPGVVLEKPLRTQQFLIHLYGHLNWHLGQIDSIRRFGTGDGAIKLAGL